MPIDYEILRIIWWLLIGVLLIGFAITGGFDLGIATLLPWVARNDIQRRIVINAIGPTWEGNQVWFILAGGAIFAAWPILYAVSFSGFYLAMLIILLALILRPVGFKYRSKLTNPQWRQTWDIALFLGGVIPAIIFGVAVGNVLQGVPFHFDQDLRSFYTGNLWALLNPFALLCGFISVSMLVMHGGIFLAIKTDDKVCSRAIISTRIAASFLILFFATAGLWITWGIAGYSVIGTVATDGPSNPLYKEVSQQLGAWLNNYKGSPWLILAPSLGFIGALLAALFVSKRNNVISFSASSLSIFGIISTVGVSMFPFLLPSSTHPQHSLLVWDASSSQLTLFIMLIATIIFMPIIILYTGWTYRVLRGKVTVKEIVENERTAY